MFRNWILLVITFLLTFSSLFAQDTILPLTRKEKIEDFTYLYEELKASYPYFDVNKRLHQMDWLANRKQYQKRIKHSKNDRAFVENIVSILDDLNNGHTDIYPTLIYDYFYQGYSYYAKENPEIQVYVDELEKTNQEKCTYWNTLLNGHRADNEETKAESNEGTVHEETVPNVTFQLDEASSTALLKIRSFSYELIESDQQTLATFFQKADNFDELIIDIRGNTGGDDSYWREHIVPHLIAEDVEYPVILAFKPSEKILAFKPQYEETTSVHRLELPSIPHELYDQNFRVYNTTLRIEANKREYKHFKKKYVLVDRYVYSSSESFAYFCKATNFAQVAGERTGGDGIGTDPLVLTLPNSGIVLRFTGAMALNPDGSSNEEMKTTPDIRLEDLDSLQSIEEIKAHIQEQTK